MELQILLGLNNADIVATSATDKDGDRSVFIQQI